MPEAVQRPLRDGHGRLEARVSGVGDGHLPDADEPQERVEHEAAQGLGHHSEVRLASRPSGSVTAFESGGSMFAGPVEVDETYMGGKRANMSKSKREQLSGRGTVGKTAIVGAKDRATNQVRAAVVERPDKPTVHGFVAKHTSPDATVYTDEALVYETLPNHRQAVNHSVLEYVRGEIHTNGIESFWSMLKRSHKGTFHKMSPKHLGRYVQEFEAKAQPERKRYSRYHGSRCHWEWTASGSSMRIP